MSKPNLVLLPGLLSNELLFDSQIRKLQAIANVDIITVSDVNSPTAMINRILNLAPDYFVVAGHSLGGWLAVRLLTIAPHRISKLCLLNTAIEKVDLREIIARRALLAEIENGEFYHVACKLAAKFTLTEQSREKVLQMFLQVGQQKLINQTQAMLVREDLKKWLPTIHCPTWVLHAEQDYRFTFSSVRETAELIPQSTFKVIPNCGHMSPIECPKAILDFIIDWLQV